MKFEVELHTNDTVNPGTGVAVIAFLSVCDLKEYRTKSECRANHRDTHDLEVFNCMYPLKTQGALAGT